MKRHANTMMIAASALALGLATGAPAQDADDLDMDGAATEMPEVTPDAPEADMPESEAPDAEAPESEAPESEAPEADDPDAAAPEADAPEADAPDDADAPDADAPAADELEGSSSDTFINEQDPAHTLATSIIGASIVEGVDPDGKSIGTVKDLILDEENAVTGVLAGVGGVLGMGEKHIGISWDAIESVDPQSRVVAVSFSAEDLEGAPDYLTTEEQERQREIEQLEQQPLDDGMGGAPAPGLAQ